MNLPNVRWMKKVRTRSGKTRSRLSRLIREGIVRPARAPFSDTLFYGQPVRLKGDASLVAALIEERREGYIAERAARADLPKALRILKRAGAGRAPAKGDELPRPKRKRWWGGGGA